MSIFYGEVGDKRAYHRQRMSSSRTEFAVFRPPPFKHTARRIGGLVQDP